MMNNFYVITGGPGSGKTSLLNELERRGYDCTPEVARQIIQEQLSLGENALPWGDVHRYTRLMLERSVQDFFLLQESKGIRFFDRGIPDTLAYAALAGVRLSQEQKETAVRFRYNHVVFMLSPWDEIYCTDAERKQDLAEAVRTYGQLVREYENLGYELMEVPHSSIGARADFVVRCLQR